MQNFKVYKVGFKLPVSISVSPVHSLDDGACHERNLVGAGEIIRQCIAWPSGSLLVGSGPVRRPQGFPSYYESYNIGEIKIRKKACGYWSCVRVLPQENLCV